MIDKIILDLIAFFMMTAVLETAKSFTVAALILLVIAGGALGSILGIIDVDE